MPLQAELNILEFRSRRATPAFQLVDDFARRQQGLSEDSPRPGAIGTVQFQIVDEFRDGAWQSLSTPLAMEVVRSPSGLFLFHGVVSRPTRPASQAKLWPGRFRARVRADYYQRITTDGFDFPPPDGSNPIVELTLKPNHSYPFPAGGSPRGGDRPTLLRGALHRAGGEGVSEAMVATTIPIPDRPDRLRRSATFSDQCITDPSGQWVLVLSDEVFPDRKPIDVMLDVTYPGQASVPVVRRNVTPWQDNLVGETSFRGRVELANGFGIRDSAITVRNFPGQSKSDADGNWRYYFPFGPPIGIPLEITAAVTGKPSQTQTAQPRVGETTSVPAFVFN